MHTIVTKWGNSLAIRIPKYLSSKINVVNGDEVDLKLEDDKIVIKKISAKTRRPCKGDKARKPSFRRGRIII